MRVLFITTETNNCDPVVESYGRLVGPAPEGVEPIAAPVCRMRFWHERPRIDGDLVLLAERWASRCVADGVPGRLVYIGAAHAPGVPGDDSLRMLARAAYRAGSAGLVHLCFDGGDAPWWDIVRRYHAMTVPEGPAFSMQVNIDGAPWCLDGEVRAMTALCPVDPVPYGYTGHGLAVLDADVGVRPAEIEGATGEKDVAIGFAGGAWSGIRQQILGTLEPYGLTIRHRTGFETRDYADYAKFMRRCKMVVNIPVSGSGRYMHVKSRIVEAGLAGAAVLEHAQSPAHNWFPGALIPYSDEASLRAGAQVEEAERIERAAKLRAAVLAEHMPGKFWGRVLA